MIQARVLFLIFVAGLLLTGPGFVRATVPLGASAASASAGASSASAPVGASAASAPVGASAASESPVPVADDRGHEAGTPLIRNFGAADTGGAVQNWGVVQDHRGVIYVANTEDGVLEYDGIRWRAIPTPERTTIRSLAVDARGRVYVGGVGDLGYLAPDSTGQMQFISLRDRLAPQDRDFADVWRTYATPRGVYFSTFKRLIRISDDDVRVWPASGQFHLASVVGDQMYVREAGRGLLRLVDDELQLVAGGERFAAEKIYVMLPWSDERMLIGTRTQGWFIYDGERLQPWATSVDAELERDHVYGAIWLQDGRLAVATLRGGVYLLDRRGSLLGRIDKSTGLIDQTVFHLFQDRQGALWLALDKGLARVEVSVPLTIFGERSGIEGSVVALHRHAGTLYAGTTQGLFRLDTRPQRAPRFVAVPGGDDQTWGFLDHDDALLIAHIRGVYEVRDGRLHLVLPTEQAAFTLQRSRRDPARIFVGLQDGIVSMRRANGRWIAEGPIADMTDEVRSIVEEADGVLWLGTFSTGVVRLAPLQASDSAGRSTYRIERFGPDHGVSRGTSYVHVVGGRLTAATSQGLYRFDAAASRFVSDERFAGLFPEQRAISALAEDVQGRVWMFANDQVHTVKETGAATVDATGRFHWDPRTMRHAASDSILAILVDDGVIWFGGDEGVYRYDARRPLQYSQPFAAQIRAVSKRNGDRLFGGAGLAAVPQLAFADNALRFEFAAPGYDLRPTRFQVFLEGADSGWTQWGTGAYSDYTNLREGAYRLRVRAMNPYDAVSEEGVYDFTVLPPWYRTRPAYIAYVLLAAGLIVVLSRWRSAALQSRNRELAQLVAVRTEELSNANQALQAANQALQTANKSLADLSVTDVLTGLRNRRYLVDTIGHDVAATLRAARDSEDGALIDSSHDLLFVMVDIDHFKQVNDYYGHAAGDRVLEQFAAILRGVCRDTDTPVRWGGEEFMIVARGMSRDAGSALAERIRAQTAAHIFQLDEGKTLRRTCSVGFASFPVCPMSPGRFSWETAVEFADQCLYEAKRSGRNGWVGARGTQQVPPRDDEIDFSDLQNAVNGGYLEVLQSPQRGERRARAG